MSICDNTTVNQETPLKLRKTKHVAMLAKELSIKLELDGVPRYFIKKSTAVQVTAIKKYRGTSNGNKKVPRFFSKRYSPPLIVIHKAILFVIQN